MMNDQYDSSFDVGIAVEAEEAKSSALSTATAKSKRPRVPSTSVAEPAVLDDEASTGNGAVASTRTIPSANATRKRSKKKKKHDNNEKMVGGAINAKSPVDVAPPLSPLKGMFIEERRNLPVYQHRADICNLVSNNDVVLVVAETVSLSRFP